MAGTPFFAVPYASQHSATDLFNIEHHARDMTHPKL